MATSGFEPILPESKGLVDTAGEILAEAARVGRSMHPIVLDAVAELLRTVNCYYSNLIEGHDTHPVEIERAMRGEYATGSFERHLQEEAKAHIEVQRAIEERLRNEPAANPSSEEFIRWIHREFYVRIPEEFRVVKNPETGKTAPVLPGELRNYEVKVGRHLPPHHDELSEYLKRVSDAYNPARLTPSKALVSLAAANHRLLWVHPFGDGNGRVTRLMTDAYLLRISAGGYGLWNVSRGLARMKKEYLAALEAADAPRWNDLDGRGSLSLKGLEEFCRFFLKVCRDQLAYMNGLVEPDGLRERVVKYGASRKLGLLPGISRKPDTGNLFKDDVIRLLEYLSLRGKVERAEVERITGSSGRTSRRAVRVLVDEGFIESRSHRAELRLRIPAHAAPYLFPQLYAPLP
jgi:Fic family protein